MTNSQQRRTRPNVLLTGTPGTGKSSTAALLKSKMQRNDVPLEVISVSDLIKAKHLYNEKDDELDTLIYDDEKVRLWLE